MFRRQFVQLLATAGAGTLASFVSAETKAGQTVTYFVKGFSCVTCAVGLDTMLQQQKGIVSSKSSYPDGIVIIKFDPSQVSEAMIRASIADMGFKVEEKR